MNNMVGLQFENVRLQADVEVLLAGLIFPGKVKWKGVMSGRHGSWIGIELRRRSKHTLIYQLLSVLCQLLKDVCNLVNSGLEQNHWFPIIWLVWLPLLAQVRS